MDTLHIAGTGGNHFTTGTARPINKRHAARNSKLRAAGYRKPEQTGAVKPSRVTLRDPAGKAPVRQYTAAEIAAFNLNK
jgi:hypothetical protein